MKNYPLDWTRRRFLSALAVSPAGVVRKTATRAPLAQTENLRQRFPDLHRRFVFEYYPWYGTEPWRHWNNRNRRPPTDIAASSMPFLGPYDSRELAVIEQHARWIAEAGVGSIALSWWGVGSFSDRAVHTVMDVMRDHDIKVTFGLEPYRDDRGSHYVDDIQFLLTEYGSKRGWDAFLLLRSESGDECPVFKSFRTILPERMRDCHGVWSPVKDFTSDALWREQTDAVRELVRRDFNSVVLLADSLHMDRTRDSGFDGIGIYDNFVRPERYAREALLGLSSGFVILIQYQSRL